MEEHPLVIKDIFGGDGMDGGKGKKEKKFTIKKQYIFNT